MTQHHAERVLPFSRRQMFDLVADVERYPDFVPWWIAARVTGKRHLVYHTEQIMGMGPVRLRFQSDTTLHPPDRISVVSHGDAIKDMNLVWRFDEHPEGCLISLDMTMVLGARKLEKLLAGMTEEAAVKLVEAFEKRAHVLFSEDF
ncbi:type II toxin-antitoxin system RatA family toxin [Rhodospirillum sp. A1_3_36]|uniref:type II toxin-antitoxin system RatA family toxin n=1 Tax=Rhodospirillum sp. A1_3_36 TaxID=3391666 RepID=UPI0039A48815